MNDSTLHYTPTLARLYADQGYYDKAIEIYQVLIRKFPQRSDLLDEFADVLARTRQLKTSNEPNLAMLFKQWFDLITKYKQVRWMNREREG